MKYLYHNYYYEKEIKKKLLELNSYKSDIDMKDVENKINTIEEKGGFTYGDEQREAIKLACQHSVLILNGKGGVGKSFTVNGILSVLDNYSHACCALSGKTSYVLGM